MDNSQLQEYMACPFRYKMHYLEGWQKREEGKLEHHAAWGDAVHRGLECLYQGKDEFDAFQAFQARYPVQLDEGDLAKTTETGVSLLEQYRVHYKDEDKSWKVLQTEEVAEFELKDGVKWTVKIDLVAENTEHGGVYVWDHKTTGKPLSSYYWSQFDLSGALTGYAKYVEQKYGRCDGVIINGLSVGHRKRAYKGLPPGFHCDFKREMFNRSPQDLEMWEKNTISWIRKLDEDGASKRFLRNYGNACGWCQFREICMAGWDAEDEENIEVMYKKVNPFQYLEDGK